MTKTGAEAAHPLDPYAIAAFAARQGITDALAAAEAFAALTPGGRETWRSVADAVLMLRDLGQPADAPALQFTPAGYQELASLRERLDAGDRSQDGRRRDLTEARDADIDADLVTANEQLGEALTQERKSLAGTEADVARLEREARRLREHLASKDEALAAYATALDEAEAERDRYAIHLRQELREKPFELRSDADDAMAAELEVRYPPAGDDEDMTNRDVDPDACDAADLNDFGDAEDGA